MSLHEDIPGKVNKVFVNQPSDQRGGDLDPLGPPWYFGLPTVHSDTPPLPPNKPDCWSLNYLEYVKDFDLDAHVKIFKVAIKANSETNDVEILNLFNFTLKDIMSN